MSEAPIEGSRSFQQCPSKPFWLRGSGWRCHTQPAFILLGSRVYFSRHLFESCIPWTVHPASISGGSGGCGLFGNLRASSRALPAPPRSGRLRGPSPSPFPRACDSAPQRPLRRQGPPGSGATRARGGARGGARRYLGRRGAGGGLFGDSRRPPPDSHRQPPGSSGLRA